MSTVEIRNTVVMPSGKQMFRWEDGVFRETPEDKKTLRVVEGVEIPPRDISPSDRGRYRTFGRALAKLLAGKSSDPELTGKLIPTYVPKLEMRVATQSLVVMASESGRPKEQQRREVIEPSLERFLQSVGVRTVQVRRDLAVIGSQFPLDESTTIQATEAAMRSLNEQYPPITKIDGQVRYEIPNTNMAARIIKGQLEQRRSELRAAQKPSSSIKPRWRKHKT